jgi:hypothetical protein
MSDNKQVPPLRLKPEALSIIKKYQDQLAEKASGYVRVYPSDAVIYMDDLIINRAGPANVKSIDRNVTNGNDPKISMPKEWAGKKVKVIEVLD